MSEVLGAIYRAVRGSHGREYSRKRAAPLHQTDCGKPGSSFSRRPQPFEPSARRHSRIGADLMYWAQGLSHTCFEGALTRALGGHPIALATGTVIATRL